MAELTLSRLEKSYPGTRKSPPFAAVKGIDLQVRDREFMALVGPSGCGKSTTLRMIAGLEEISGGEIAIDGAVVNDLAPKDRDIAMVFQNYALYPHMTVHQNLAFGLKLRKFPRSEVDQRVKQAAALLGLDGLLDRKPKALSGGQRQRVAVGRAIVRQPKVFLFDEPLSNLDAKMRISMRAEISKLHARLNATMVYVTHDQVEAMTMGDRICVMNEGEIMQVAEPMELYERPANLFVAGFIGSPSMNLIHGTVQQLEGKRVFREDHPEGSGFTLPLGDHFPDAEIDEPTVLGLRPEALNDADSSLARSDAPSIGARVDVSEPMGSETFLYLETGSHRLVARVPPETRYDPEQNVKIQMDLAKAHRFDPKSGKRCEDPHGSLAGSA